MNKKKDLTQRWNAWVCLEKIVRRLNELTESLIPGKQTGRHGLGSEIQG
jgi:hypothetical protein